MYPNKFYSFANGEPVDDKTINEWLEEIRLDLINQEDGATYTIRSGDAFVYGKKYADEYEFIVANRNGYSDFTVWRDEVDISKISFI